MAEKSEVKEAQNPLLLRAHRLMEAFAKSDDERDFYLDRQEGFLIYVDVDKPETELNLLEEELKNSADRYCLIPKLTFYEAKKFMENFVNEKVYDIDTKEKLLEIIQAKESREHFLEFINDHHSELEKWQQFYQERSRIRIIEWLRNNHFHFVFEEDLELPANVIEMVKEQLFETKPSKEVLAARKTIALKSKTYYSNEALNPRPKRGRPPKQALKPEIEHQISKDIYLMVPAPVRPFLFSPDISVPSDITFSSKFEGIDGRSAQRQTVPDHSGYDLNSINKKLQDIRNLSKQMIDNDDFNVDSLDFDEEDETEDEDLDDIFEEDEVVTKKPVSSSSEKKEKKEKSEPAETKKNQKIAASTKKEKTPPAKTEKKVAKAPLKQVSKSPAPKPAKVASKEPSKKKAHLRRTNKK